MTICPVDDRKSQLLGYPEYILELCSLFVKCYKNKHFTKFSFKLKWKLLEEKKEEI